MFLRNVGRLLGYYITSQRIVLSTVMPARTSDLKITRNFRYNKRLVIPHQLRMILDHEIGYTINNGEAIPPLPYMSSWHSA
jgi:hypothetical protein